MFSTSSNSPNWRTTPFRQSTTAYSIYSQPPSIAEAAPPSAAWRRAMPCWQETAYHGHMQSKTGNAHVWRACSCHGYQWRLGSLLSQDAEGCELCKLLLAQLILKLLVPTTTRTNHVSCTWKHKHHFKAISPATESLQCFTSDFRHQITL